MSNANFSADFKFEQKSVRILPASIFSFPRLCFCLCFLLLGKGWLPDHSAWLHNSWWQKAGCSWFLNRFANMVSRSRPSRRLAHFAICGLLWYQYHRTLVAKSREAASLYDVTFIFYCGRFQTVSHIFHVIFYKARKQDVVWIFLLVEEGTLIFLGLPLCFEYPLTDMFLLPVQSV